MQSLLIVINEDKKVHKPVITLIKNFTKIHWSVIKLYDKGSKYYTGKMYSWAEFDE